ASTLSGTPFAPLEEQVRRNMDLFQQTFSMFKPFARPTTSDDKEPEPSAGDDDNIDELRRQMKEMQDRLDRMSKDTKKEEGGSPVPAEALKIVASPIPHHACYCLVLHPLGGVLILSLRKIDSMSPAKARSSAEAAMFSTKAPPILTVANLGENCGTRGVTGGK